MRLVATGLPEPLFLASLPQPVSLPVLPGHPSKFVGGLFEPKMDKCVLAVNSHHAAKTS